MRVLWIPDSSRQGLFGSCTLWQVLSPTGYHAWCTYGVGSGNDSAASLQGGDNASLRDGDTLLLHGLMDTGSVLVIHLQESNA